MLLLDSAELARLRTILQDADEPELLRKVEEEMEHQKSLDEMVQEVNKGFDAFMKEFGQDTAADAK